MGRIGKFCQDNFLVLDAIPEEYRHEYVIYTGLLLLFLAYLVFVKYLLEYAYWNPDPQHCMYVDGLTTTTNSRVEARELASNEGLKLREGYPIDMGHIFHVWFKWGFWGSIAQLCLVPLVSLVSKHCRRKKAECVSVSLFVLNCASTIVWLCLGVFWRYTKGGRLCSGELIDP